MEEIKFENYNLDQNIILALEKLGFDKPTKVQERVLPLALNNKDVIVKSKTGSGKTACFGIPICENIDLEEKLPQALIISPTRELSIQIKDDISKIGRLKKIRCLAVYGKEPIAMQKRKLSQRVHVVSGTPGRILDHLEKGSLNLDKVKYLILDEADKMLNMGFIKDVEKIIKYVPKKRTTMLFSATISEDIDYICRKHMMDAERIEIEEDKQENTIDECYYVTSYHEKYSFLLDVIYSEMPERCIIFCNTKETVANLTDKLKSKDFSCESIHGDMEQRDRIETMNRFKRDEFVFLIATDVAARGIHIDGISHVVNYDIPREKESYIHRIGRTGRAGEFGKAISVVTTGEVRILKEIEDYIDRKIEERFIENQTLIEENKIIYKEKMENRPKTNKIVEEKIDEGITKIYINGGKKKKIRALDLVGAISSIEGVIGDDIGIIDILDYVSYVDILANKGDLVLKELSNRTIKGKKFKVQLAKK